MIPIKNIYYMLSYAYQSLREQGYKSLETENFENVADLFSAILSKSIALQVKRGLNQEYIENHFLISGAKGKIDISETIKKGATLKKQLFCNYDEFSVNSYLNRIIKTTVLYLIRADVPVSRKKDLRKLLLYFSDVESLNLNDIDWHIRFNRNNQAYQLIIAICQLTLKGLIHSDNTQGAHKLMTYLDDQRMCRLYEKFLLAFYRKTYPNLSVTSSQISWQLDNDFDEMLPVMQSDIMLSYQDKILIIDAKYYGHTTQQQYDSLTLHSSNLYQIFTYVKNKEYELRNVSHEVSGMLLYAKTSDNVLKNNTYLMSGNKISVATLDLDCEFTRIKEQLKSIVAQYFDKSLLTDII